VKQADLILYGSLQAFRIPWLGVGEMKHPNLLPHRREALAEELAIEL
jgi:hypothetical protein